jgi:hypothetical protein
MNQANKYNHEECGLVSVTPFSSERLRRNISPPSSGSKSKASKKPGKAGGKLSLLFYPEDGGDMFLRNVGFSPNFMELQPRDPYRRENLKCKYKHV